MIDELKKVISNNTDYKSIAEKNIRSEIGDNQFVIMTKDTTVIFAKVENDKENEIGDNDDAEDEDEFNIDDMEEKSNEEIIVGKVTSKKDDDTVRIDCGDGAIEIFHPKFQGKFKKGEKISISIMKAIKK